MAIRDLKRLARQDLHAEMQIPAYYIVPATPGPWTEPVSCGVRLHLSFQALGTLKGNDSSFAQREEEPARAIFKRSEVASPARGAVISVAEGEAYRIDHTKVPDDEFVTAYIVPVINADELATMTWPGST